VLAFIRKRSFLDVSPEGHCGLAMLEAEVVEVAFRCGWAWSSSMTGRKQAKEADRREVHLLGESGGVANRGATQSPLLAAERHHMDAAGEPLIRSTRAQRGIRQVQQSHNACSIGKDFVPLFERSIGRYRFSFVAPVDDFVE
jgi:hypothetical protein